MDVLNIVISGNSLESFDFYSKLPDSRHNIFMNENSSHQMIDLLIIFGPVDDSLKKYINNKTICFCFDPSITLNIPNLYQCHFENPSNGEMQNHLKFIIDTEVHDISSKFSQIYGILSSIGYEIQFTDSSNSVFEPMLAASSIHLATKDEEKEEIVVCDPKTTIFHLIIALDCTGSMSSAINNIRTSLLRIVNEINSEFKNILISFYAFRDYCDEQIIRKTLFKEDCELITSAIRLENASGGGDIPEAHKTCLAEIQNDISQRKEEMTNVCFFITDAPPHSENYIQEANALNARHFEFATNWIELANTLLDDGIQVFSFITTSYKETSIPMSIMSQITQGLCFIIPDDSSIFERQMISIVSNLMNSTNAQVIDGIRMVVPTSDLQNISKEKDMYNTEVKEEIDRSNIQQALAEKGSLMRLKPSDRGAKRVTISSSELLETGTVAIKGLKALYNIVKGDASSYNFFEGNPIFTKFVKQLKEAEPNKEWISKSSISCICSMMTVADSFEILNEIDEDDLKVSKDITKIVETLGNFVIGYPFLFQLNENGKFNMQDAWPIIFKDATTAYTMSISSLYHIISQVPKSSSNCSMINKFKDFVASNERSGIVPICADELTKYVLKILDVTKWLDALVSYGLHRHIEPLPSITRSTCCAFITTISKQAFKSKNSSISSSQSEALHLVTQTLDSLISQGCQSMMSEFTKDIINQQISYNAYSPQEPYNCSGINKIINCFFQLKEVIKSANHDFMVKFFYQGIHEYISMLKQFIDDEKKNYLIHQIFDEIHVDVEQVTEQNPLEMQEPSNLKSFEYHIIDNHHICQLAVFVFKVIWNLLRNDEFEEPTQLMLTASLAQAISIQTRSFKYQKIPNENEDAKEKYEIKPMFATQDPIEILRVSCFIYFKQTNAESILTLQANRKQYLINEAIEKILIPFRNCDFEEFFSSLLEGFLLEWMEDPFKLSIIHSQNIFSAMINNVKRIEPNCQDFYENVFYILALGKDKIGHNWAVGSCRDNEIVNAYINQFLNGDQAVAKYYNEHCSRPQPNRHGHHIVFCPCQDTYTEEYARSRIICAIAPFYFIPELPKEIRPMNKNLVLHLSHKLNAPPLNQIYALAENVTNEMLALKYKE